MATEWELPRLRVDVNGDWFDDDVEVTHPGVLSNLRGNLRRDAQGYFIQTRVRIPVEVVDVPFVVVRFERGAGGLTAVLNDGSEERVEPATLRIGQADVPYCTVKGGTFEARFSRAVEHPETLKWMPCMCGCGNLGHTSNRACYIKAESEGQITFTSHAAT